MSVLIRWYIADLPVKCHHHVINSIRSTVVDAIDVDVPLHCVQSTRIPWIPTEPPGLDVYEPWMNYPLSERQCCELDYPNEVFDAQGMLFNHCLAIVISASHYTLGIPTLIPAIAGLY